MYRLLFLLVVVITSCRPSFHLAVESRLSKPLRGSEFYKKVAGLDREKREDVAVEQILGGNMPPFLKKFVRINTAITGRDGRNISAFYFVSPDYISIGSEDDFARVPLTPMTAQKIADSFHCFLPTTKIVDEIYAHAKVKLAPMPMFAFRDSAPTFYHHHLMIEGQRKGRKGLIAGIKKDVVISDRLKRDNKNDRVAIYGWHQLDGKPIQPLYTGHVNWYVDYSHGIRLVYRTIWVNKKPMDYTEVMKDPELRPLICNEQACDVYRY